MSKSLVDVMWEQEMLGINDRLWAVAQRFRSILIWSASDAGLLDTRKWPNDTALHQIDEQLVAFLVQKWLPEVNMLIQRGVSRLGDEQEGVSFFVQDVMMMREVHVDEVEALVEKASDPIEFVAVRAEQLMGFHQAVAQRTGVEEGFKGVQGRQRRFAKENFPLATSIDLSLLEELHRWRMNVHEKLVSPFLERAARESDGGQESITRIMIDAVKIAQGPAAA